MTKASKDTNSLQASYVDDGVCTDAYVDSDLILHKFLIDVQLQTSRVHGNLGIVSLTALTKIPNKQVQLLFTGFEWGG